MELETTIRPNDSYDLILVLENASTNLASRNTIGQLDSDKLLVPFYVIILFFSFVGNILVISTLVVNRGMRTVTNLFLLNLAISDLLLGVFCVPFTLTGVLLREFVFGRAMCSIIPYLQAVSVSVNAWTLVSMSIERYFAICHPLKSRKWQTSSHAVKIVILVWMGSLVCMMPIACVSRLQPLQGTGKFKCRESWPWEGAEISFNLFLDCILLVIPLIIMSATYSMIIRTLWRALAICSEDISDNIRDLNRNWNSTESMNQCTRVQSRSSRAFGAESTIIRRTNQEHCVLQKKRVIKMLFVVVLEFFICWTPLYTMNTMALFNPALIYSTIGYKGICAIQILAYISSCCNPITYCFMNARFRDSFWNLCPCKKNVNVFSTQSVR